MRDSWQRAIINQKNAAQSTGPRTQAGKRRSRTNARSHGLSARLDLLDIEDPAILAIANELVADDDGFPLALAKQFVTTQVGMQRIRKVRVFLVREIGTWPRKGVARPESDAAKTFRNLGLDVASPVAIALRRLLRRLDRAVLLQQQTRAEQLKRLYAMLSQLDRYEAKMLHQRNRIMRQISSTRS